MKTKLDYTKILESKDDDLLLELWFEPQESEQIGIDTDSESFLQALEEILYKRGLLVNNEAQIKQEKELNEALQSKPIYEGSKPLSLLFIPLAVGIEILTSFILLGLSILFYFGPYSKPSLLVSAGLFAVNIFLLTKFVLALLKNSQLALQKAKDYWNIDMLIQVACVLVLFVSLGEANQWVFYLASRSVYYLTVNRYLNKHVKVIPDAEIKQNTGVVQLLKGESQIQL